MKVEQIAAVVRQIVPLELAQGWDNVGLLVGEAGREVKNILLTIDVTAEVVQEAEKFKCELIVSYHPVIWEGLRQVTAEGPGRVVYELIRRGISVFSIHTALDAAAGGVNDALAEVVGIHQARPLGDYVEGTESQYKLVVFVPLEAVEKVSRAVFSAGAGVIGNYCCCSFGTEGTGTFVPMEAAKPTIGKRGRLEHVTEMRLETIVPARKLEAVVAAMKQAHPYETPAFDIYKLCEVGERPGLGRIGPMKQPVLVSQILGRLRKELGAKAVGIVGNEKRQVRTAAVCAGSCGKLIEAVIAAKADCYVTGELKHHHALAAQEAGVTCVCLSHTVSERFVLKRLARELKNRLGSITIRISKKDRDPFTWKLL